MMTNFVARLGLLGLVSGIHVERHGHDRAMLWDRLKEFAEGSDWITVESIKKAYTARDKYGVLLSIPPLEYILQADSNKDGNLTAGELWHWNGYDGRRYCKDFGDRPYGCVDRCMNGIERMDGDATFFEQYEVEVLPDLDQEMEDVAASGTVERYKAQFSSAQRRAISALLDGVMEANIPGHIVQLGLKDVNSWRWLHQGMEGSEKERQLHLFDSFKGMEACDHVRDTGMCPPEGSQKVNKQGILDSVERYRSHRDIHVHEVNYAELEKMLPEQVAFVLIDGSVFPTVSAMLAGVHSKMAEGGKIVVHDFGWEGLPGVQRATSSFLLKEGKGLRVSLPASVEGVACYLGVISY